MPNLARGPGLSVRVSSNHRRHEGHTTLGRGYRPWPGFVFLVAKKTREMFKGLRGTCFCWGVWSGCTPVPRVQAEYARLERNSCIKAAAWPGGANGP